MAKSGFRPAAPLALLTALLAGVAGAATFDVSNNADDGPGSLRQAILDANASADDDTITFSFDPGDGAILLDSALPVIEGSVTLNGAGVAGLTIDGADSHRVFFVLEGAVEIQELTVRNGFAQGGAGSGRGGGGLGAGGALFVGENASVTLSGVAFEDNRAQGGDGGDASTNGGGGGGLGGDGGSGSGGGGGGTLGSGGSSNGGAGGGGGSEGDGGNGTPTVAGSGGTGGDPDGGAGGAFNVSGSPGGAGGGGGGGGPFSGLNSPSGGAGGRFGGGGGGTGGGLGGAGGEYGGGGGAGGDGGFGGGGGGGSGGIAPGSGGFGAGDGGSTTGGGGGSAFGGGIFVQAGGQLEIVNSSLSNDEVDTLVPGAGGGGGMDGEAEGGSLYIPLDAQVTFTTDAGNRSIFGSIGGEGGIVTRGSDRLDLFGANTYSGGTVVQQGTLRGDGTSLQGEIEIQQAATLYAFQSADSTLTGSISGAGLLRKGGTGQLTLDGTNSYTGGTLLEGGRIRGDSDSLTGDFVMLTGTRLIFRQVGSTGTHAGDISGLGRVLKRGDGTVILTGANSYTGGTLVGAGVLQGDTDSLQGMITVNANASLVFDQALDGTFADSIDGAGEVRKQGAGQLLVSGSWIHDVTTVAAGRLDLTGLIQNDVDVLSGAVFGGNGNVGGELQPFAGATVSPGLAGLLGTLDAASVRFDAGSVFSVDIDPDTLTSDRLDVAGTATLDMAATVSVNRLPGDLGGAEVYTIVDAANVVGGFAPATLEDLAFFDGSVATVASDVILTLAPNGSTFEDWATTPNQTAVARVLDVELPLPTGNADLDDVFGNLFGLTEQGVATALDDISGEGITAFTTVRLANGRQFARTATARLGVVGGRMVGGTGTADLVASLPGGARPGGALAALDGLGAGGATASSWLMAAAGPSVSMGIEKRQRFAFWLDPYGLLGGVDGDGNSADTQWWAAGVSGGFDGRIGDHGLLGLAAAWAHLDVDADARRFSGDANVFQGGVYGAWVGERLYASGLARYAYSDLAHKRTIAFGEINHRPEGDSAGHEAGVHAELGWVAFSPVGLQIEPMAGLDYTWLSRDGFSESGSGAGSSLNLDVGSESWNSLLTTVGLRVHRRFVFGDTERLTFMPEIWARWAHEFGDRDRPLDAALSGAVNGGPFRVTGARMARDGALLGIGWSVNRSNDLSFLTYYDLGWNPDALSHALAIGVIFRW